MTIKINGEPQTVDREAVTLTELLSLKNVETPDMVTVQINGNFVDRAAFSTTRIQENDEVEFLYFLGGGAADR